MKRSGRRGGQLFGGFKGAFFPPSAYSWRSQQCASPGGDWSLSIRLLGAGAGISQGLGGGGAHTHLRSDKQLGAGLAWTLSQPPGW